MKKRILSLLLAAAMVFTSGVMVAGVEADAATEGDFMVLKTNNNTDITTAGVVIRATDSEGDWLDSSVDYSSVDVASMGDVLSVNWGNSKNTIMVKSKNGYVNNISSSKLNVIWYAMDPDDGGDWSEAVMLGEGDSYTITDKKYIGWFIGNILWTTGTDGNSVKFETAKEIFDGFGDVTGDVIVDKDSHAFAVINSAMISVKHGDVKGSQFNVDTAQLGSDDAVNYGKVYFINKKDAAKLNVTFTLADYERADYSSKSDIASKDSTTQNRDGIVWQLVDATTSNPTVKAVTTGGGTGVADGQIDGEKATGSTNAVTSKGAVDIGKTYTFYVNVPFANKGKVYDATAHTVAGVAGNAYKTNYKLAVVTPDPTDMIVLDLQLGDKQTREGGVGTFEVVETTSYLVRGVNVNNPEVKLPTSLRRVTKDASGKTIKTEYLQGWSTSANGLNLVSTDSPKIYSSKIYYAVWGDEIKGDRTTVYRLYNPSTGEHLYTGDYNEYVVNGRNGWKQEGISWYGVDLNGKETETEKYSRVRRLYNKVSHEHLYTLDGGNEMNQLLKNPNWVAEQVVFIGALQGTSIYRLFNPNSGSNARASHLWTVDANEMNYLRTRGWNYEGVPFFGVAQ